MRQIDYLKLFAWLGLLTLCAMFWILVLNSKVFLYSSIIVLILTILMIRKELK